MANAKKQAEHRRRRYIRLKARIREISATDGVRIDYRHQDHIAELYAHYPAPISDSTLRAAIKAHIV